ncbi:hypothetical protein ES319_D05G317300v1 [Gossypium barbadense]|uniref:Dirigent protein n=1 Tax=Gossypium barbadense TaxID=3634 RepID=A0A5J5RK02_GOSBA|nr:hypothetical protein ES319_D05G317300v1 [Gossypium barbadense]
METYKLISALLLTFTIAFSTSARMLDEQPSNPSNPVSTHVSNVPPLTTPPGSNPNPTVVGGATSGPNPVNPNPDHHTLTFFMHDILGGSNPTALAITGIVNNPAINGQLLFAKPNGANLPLNNGINQNTGNTGILNNNNLPLLTGLGGNTQALNNGKNLNNGASNFPVLTGGQLPSGSALQKLMFGTMTVIDDELTVGHELGSGFLGKAQGFYVASSIDGNSQTMAFTAMFESGHYADTLSFFGVHRIGVSESHLAIMGGTGKYVNAKGFTIVKTIPASNQQQETDGFETVLEFTVYITY